MALTTLKSLGKTEYENVKRDVEILLRIRDDLNELNSEDEGYLELRDCVREISISKIQNLTKLFHLHCIEQPHTETTDSRSSEDTLSDISYKEGCDRNKQ